jgi:UDP-N-acetylglucosamine enolpyruvyl transferase
MPAAVSGRPVAQIRISGPADVHHGEDCVMRKCLLVVATCLAFVAANLAVPVQAQEGKKTMTPQRQKMKDCGAKWKEEKAQKNVSGKNAYRAFMKDCLKG